MSVYGPFFRYVVYPIRARAFGAVLMEKIARYRRVLEAPKHKIDELASQHLNDIVVHAAKTSPFWNERFRRSGINPAKIRSADDMRELPILEKVEVRQHLADILSSSVPAEHRLPATTGGSTAAPLKFYRDPECLADRIANEWVFFGWMGRRPYDRSALIWGAPGDLGNTGSVKARLRRRLLDRSIVLPGNKLNAALIDSFLEDMRRFKPKFLHGYSQAIHLVARHVLDGEREVTPVRATTVTAEPISEGQKETIATVFECPTYAIYATREFGFVAAESPNHVGWHINPLNTLVEFIKPDGSPAEPGTPGQVIVTDLLNRATPLIRYRIGDVAVPVDPSEPGDRGLPRMELAAGRETDFILTPDHRFVAGAALTNFIDPGVSKLQLVQGCETRLTIRYVRTQHFSANTLSNLRQQMADAISPQLAYEFVEVDDIPLQASGKIQYVHSEVARRRLAIHN